MSTDIITRKQYFLITHGILKFFIKTLKLNLRKYFNQVYIEYTAYLEVRKVGKHI